MVDIADTDPRLVELLRTAGDEWGALGVAEAAAQLTDTKALVRGLQHRIELAIMGRTAPRAAEAVMALLTQRQEPGQGRVEAVAEWLARRDMQGSQASWHEDAEALLAHLDARGPVYTEAQWQAEKADPEAGHTFRLKATSRGSYAHLTEDGTTSPHTDAEWMPEDVEDGFRIEVRAWNLRDALKKAASLPLSAWKEPGEH
jgi:hypothetical protein